MELDSAQTIDLAIIVIYLMFSFGIGIFSGRWISAGSDEESYYLAGRKMPGWMNGISYAVTAMNADVAPLYCGLAVVIGLPMAWYYLSRFAFAWMLVALVFAVRWWYLDVRTGPEFYSLRFGGKRAKLVRIVSAVFSIAVNMIPWLGAGLLGTHKIMGPVFDIGSKAQTLVIILPILIAYVWISGFVGVVVTDVLQSSVIVLSSIFLLCSVLLKFGGPDGLAEAIVAAHPEDHTEILAVLPVPGHEVLGPLVVLAWLIVPTIGRGGSVELEGQRLFSASSAKEASKVTIWAAVALFMMLLLLTLPVLGVLADHPEMYHSSPEVREGTFGILLSEYLPTGLLGIALAALLASVMSTVDSHLNYGAQTLVNDVFRQIFPNSKLLDPSSRSCVWIGRLSMLGILALGIVVMYKSKSLIDIAVLIAGMFASVAAFYWAQWWWWRVNFASWVAAILGGPIIYLALGQLLPFWPWWESQLKLGESHADSMAMLRAIIAIGLNVCCWVTAALIFPPESDETLRRFYLRAKPAGAWKPVEQKLREGGTEIISGNFLQSGIVIAALGAVWISLLVLGLSQLTVGRYLLSCILFAGALAGGLIFKPLYENQIARMEESHRALELVASRELENMVEDNN